MEKARKIDLPTHKIAEFCRKNHIVKLSLFGSILGDDFQVDSDIDFLVEIEPGNVPGLIGYCRIERELSELLGNRKAVEHILGMLAAGDTQQTILEGYPWLEAEDIQTCLLYARKIVGHKRIEPLDLVESAA